MWSARAALVTTLALSASACATTGATLGSGVGDTFLEHPPFYAGRDLGQLDRWSPLGVLPVAYQVGASQPDLFDPAVSAELTSFLDAMTGYLTRHGLPLIDTDADKGHRVSARNDRRVPPDVRFGCPTETGLSDDDCAEREDGALGRGRQPLLLAVGRPSPEWVTWAGARMDEAAVDHVLVITLEVGQYWIRQRGFRGTKEVELGTNHTVRFPWLTSLEGPVAVVQLTGALVGRDGRAVRIGAEGLSAKRTSLTVSGLGAQALVTDDELRQLRLQRREDLPGQPLVWEEALRRLAEQLTGRELGGRNVQ